MQQNGIDKLLSYINNNVSTVDKGMESMIRQLAGEIYMDGFSRGRHIVEDTLQHYMAQGWNIHIECKGKGREYALTYETSAAPVGKTMLDNDWTYLHAVGDSLYEAVCNLFREDGDDE
jgi:hypothetical protein